MHKHYLIVLNPLPNKQKKYWLTWLIDYLKQYQHTYYVFTTSPVLSDNQLFFQQHLNEYDEVIMLGGDGTLHLDRKFFKPEQLSAFLKEEFDLKLREIKNGKKSLVAKLIDVNNDEILFHCGEEKMTLNFIDLDLCRLKPNFEELMRVNK